MVIAVDKFWEKLKKKAKKDIDAMFGVTYTIWVVNTESNAKLYLWKNWKVLYPEIDVILKSTSDKAFIRTFQSFEFENKWLGFGRMKWNENNNKQWTLKYRTDKYLSQKLQFFGTEIWAPDWTHCRDKGKTPEVYVKLYHHFNSDSLKEGILIAIPKRKLKKSRELITSRIESIQKIIPDSTVTSLERYWTPSKGFPNRIEYINPQELKRIVFGGSEKK